MIHLDTSVLVTALTGRKTLGSALRERVAAGEQMCISTLVLYEWRRGPRIDAELQVQEFLFPGAEAIEFGEEEARLAAALYSRVPRARSRTMDLAIAACALTHDATLWTVNTDDFKDIPGLSLLPFD